MAALTAFGGKASVNRAVVNAVATALILCAFCSSVRAVQYRNSSMYYICPPKFLRLGSSCYYFSASMVPWHDAHFACQERGSNLTAPQRWEDRNLRDYLTRNEIARNERWIGGIYDWQAQHWKWGGEMRLMKYQSFSRMEKRNPEDLKWHCIAMDPNILYRWAPRKCTDPKHYICQAPLRKVERRERNRLREQWREEPNEITAPRINDYERDQLTKDDNEIVPYVPTNRRPRPRVEVNYNGDRRVDNYATNNVTPEPVILNNPKFRDDQANELFDRRSAFVHRRRAQRRRVPFRGYIRNRKDPDAAYRHNVEALRSGLTGLSNAEIDKHLRRLERMRKRDDARRRGLQRKREEHQNERVDENAANATSSTNGPTRKRNRSEKAGNKGGPQLRSLDLSRRRGRKRGRSHSLENITQRTIRVENALSASSELHPKVIVEIHEFKE